MRLYQDWRVNCGKARGALTVIGWSIVVSPSWALPGLTTRGVANCDLVELDLTLIDHPGVVNCDLAESDLTLIDHLDVAKHSSL